MVDLTCKDNTGYHLPDGWEATHNRSVAGSRPASPTQTPRSTAWADCFACFEAIRAGPPRRPPRQRSLGRSRERQRPAARQPPRVRELIATDLGPCVDCGQPATKLLVGGAGQPDTSLCEACEYRRYLAAASGRDYANEERARWCRPPIPRPELR
jgi:hypothetical protein